MKRKQSLIGGLDRILSVREASDLLSIPVDGLLKFYAGQREISTGKGRSWSIFFLERNYVRTWCLGVHYLYSKADVDNAWRKESIMWDEWIPLLQVPGAYGLDIRVVLQQIANGCVHVRPGQREQLVLRKDIKTLWKRMAE